MTKRIMMMPIYLLIGFTVIILLGSFKLITLFKF
jgi:hypothetical protein